MQFAINKSIQLIDLLIENASSSIKRYNTSGQITDSLKLPRRYHAAEDNQIEELDLAYLIELQNDWK